MKDFVKLSKLQWKKNSIWIILLIIATLLINTMTFRYNVKETYNNITISVSDFEYYLGIKGAQKKKKPEKISVEYIKYGGKLRDRVVKKYDIIPNERLSSMDSKDVDRYYSKERKDIFYKAESSIDNYDYNIEKILNENPNNALFSQYTNFFMVPFLFLLAMLLTSIEQMTNYFDFSRMLPWSKTKDFVMKIVFGLLLVLVTFGVHIGIEQVVVGTSGLSEVYNLTGILLYFVRNMLLYWLIFIIFISAGAISGNIFGHLGMAIVVFGFFNIITYLISVIKNGVLKIGVMYDIIDSFHKFVEKQHPIIKQVLDPLGESYIDNNFLIGYAIIAIIVFALGLLVVKNMKTENSGYMIVNKPIKILCQSMGILTLTSIIFTIVTSTLADYNVYIGIGIYVFFLFASYKLFKALFNIKIKV
ncbi:MAG: hypothetical protein ACTIH2_03775 [Anaerococcus sp.]